MLAAMDEMAKRLRQLHEDYAWEVNAAIARGEDRLVARLVSRYEDEALRIMTEQLPEAS
jgi:hypothetical protein